MLDLRNFVRVQVEFKNVEIIPHMLSRGRSSQRYHADIETEAKYDLRYGSTVSSRDSDHFGMIQQRAVGCEQRKPLINDPIGSAKSSNSLIPSRMRETSILDEPWMNSGFITKKLQLG
jgi:hypothetical protein